MYEQLTLFDWPKVSIGDQGYVYVMLRSSVTLGRDIVKIGHSKVPWLRRRQLDARLVAFWPGTRRYERELHRRFAACRIKGTEWFLPSAELSAWIDELVAPSN